MAADLKSAESTNWLAPNEQQFWFEQFAISPRDHVADGPRLALTFQRFQAFLKRTVYCYFKKFPAQGATETSQTNQPDAAIRRELEAKLVVGQFHELNNNNNNLQDGVSKLNLSDELRDSGTFGHEFTKQQEMHLFKKFDLNNDHLIDCEEFAQLCQRWLHRVFNPTCGLVVVDVQNDFIDGSLALINGPAKQDGAEVLPVVNKLIEAFHEHKSVIVYTQDWHPQDHVSFHANLHLRKHTPKETLHSNANDHQVDQQQQQASATNGHDLKSPPESDTTGREFKYKRFVAKANLFDTVLFDEGRVEQKLWPIHCIRDSWGAQFHPELEIKPDSIMIQKGTLSNVDAYSAFWDNMRMNETGLRQELANKRVTELFFCGLALDYCVAASALDSIKAGFITFVVDDACRGIDELEIDQRKRDLSDQGGFIVGSDLVLNYLRINMAQDDLDDDGSSKQCLSRTLIKTITYRKAFC